jgi:dolichol-phosphate mannosyltransferase
LHRAGNYDCRQEEGVSVILALPAYNEEVGLPPLLLAFRSVMYEAEIGAHSIVIADDGSTDGTRAVCELDQAHDYTTVLVHHEKNLGLGRTIEDVLRAAAERANPDDVIVTMDADNTHSPELIPQMVALIGKGYDVVIASRYREGSKMIGLSWPRLVMSYGARFVFQALCPTPGVRDFTCGFRAYRASVLQQAFCNGSVVTERGFASMAEILLKLRKLGARMCEVPMTLRYDRKAGRSKNKIMDTVMRTLRVAWKCRWAIIIAALGVAGVQFGTALLAGCASDDPFVLTMAAITGFMSAGFAATIIVARNA